MKTLIALFLVAPLAMAADLKKDLEIVKVSISIAKMVGEDQGLRNGLFTLQKKGYTVQEIFKSGYGKLFESIDTKNTKQMKKIVAKWGWPNISVFGADANSNAWLLVQHADKDVDFQEKCLPLIEESLKTKDSRPHDYAYLYDRVAVNREKLQRYGSQGMCKSAGVWEPRPIEDPKHVDERRKSVGLEPMADYVKAVSKNCY